MSIIAPLKSCRCGNSYPATPEFFYRNKGNKDGFCSLCKPCANDARREWRRQNPDKRAEQDKRYQQRHPDAIRKHQLRHYKTDSYIIKTKTDRANAIAKKANAFGRLSKSQLRALWSIQEGRCAYSGEPITLATADLDHIYPISAGGTNTLGNVMFVKRIFNFRKSNMGLQMFCRRFAFDLDEVVSRIETIQQKLETMGYTLD